MHLPLCAVLFAAVTLPSATGARAAMAQGTPATAVSAMTCAAGAVADVPALRWQGDASLKSATWKVALGPRRVSARIVVVDVDPARVALSLDLARNGGVLMPWTLNAAPDTVLLAMNAGQFTDEGPWGWVVHRGREWQQPGVGPLSGAFVVDSAGGVRIVAARAIDSVQAAGRVREALQSFPLLLEQGRPSRVLCDPTATLDREHRDIRLALGVRADGHLLIALSRYDGAGRFAERLPIGPTTMEMSAIMRRLGAVDALMLDGGLSAQLLLRHGTITQRWDGLRSVPLALVGHRIP
ncbi:phosphodiester glycosidase family protein [Gemmatimonas groenlandica]|uniref:Phosphodiester glycosidase family protein n=1 Tax=Gemmatimonas groenlandica TaxID=2732249 RepID=A0A6M4IYI4_9BACT|nr:phosphodiester glycosidase family protein [Gemmatimonas groenlandica]QJR37952.1 phosphodiester glycosidase family protein [Gemmatimonas groenlandica]